MVNEKITSEFSPRRNNIGNNFLYTKGGEFSLDGVDYIGEYHMVDEMAKTYPTSNPNSQLLRRVYKNKDHYIYDKLHDFDIAVLQFIDPKPYVYKPDEQDYSIGSDTRYFVEKVDDDNSFAIEVDQEQYSNIGRAGGIDGGLYLAASVSWKLTGRKEDIITHNENQIYKASKSVPSVNYAIKNFLEFSRITLS